MENKELIKAWKDYLKSKSHSDLDKIIEELINRSLNKKETIGGKTNGR